MYTHTRIHHAFYFILIYLCIYLDRDETHIAKSYVSQNIKKINKLNKNYKLGF